MMPDASIATSPVSWNSDQRLNHPSNKKSSMSGNCPYKMENEIETIRKMWPKKREFS